jgi:transcriptional regulator with XRE-family HTH domain
MTKNYQALRDWMDKNDVNQGELAQLAHVTQGHFSAILAGKRRMTVELLVRLSVITGLSVERLGADEDASRILKLYGIRNNRAA